MCRSLAVALVVLCAACDARIGNGTAAETSVDASTQVGIDGSTSNPADAAVPIDATVACPSGRKLYLNFTGVTLNDALASDATLNRASWMTNGVTTGTAPPYRANDANRLTLIQNITNGVKSQLAAYPIEVVTTRPASGPYMMVVYGGDDPNTLGSRFGAGVQELDCGDLVKNDVAWLNEDLATQRAINTTMGAIGFGLGLTATTSPTGCMCGWDNNCQSNNNVPCQLSTNIARDPNANQRCPGLTSQDEVAAFSTGFCQ